MKTYFRQILTWVLCLTLCMGNAMAVHAADENNTLGVVFTVELDTPTISVSDQAQTVIMRLKASEAVTLDGMSFTVTEDDPLAFTAVSGGTGMGAFSSADVNLDTGYAGWSSEDSENVTDVTELAVITLTVPANTEAGTYNVGITGLELTKDYGDVWENAANASTTLTITEEAEAVEGYTAGLSFNGNTTNVGGTVGVNIAVNHNTETVFNAGEIVVNYDSSKLEYSSITGNVTVDTATAGTLKLEDYGVDKTCGANVYTLTFQAIADGSADVTLASAAFINKAGAEKRDLIAAAELSPNKVTLTISKEQYSVTLPDIFTSDSTTVTKGESFTFSVANEHYDYDSVKATMNGADVTVTDNGDGTYTIDNVTGDLVITGNRTAKTFTVSLLGTGAADITDAVTSATYDEDYTFTMPTLENYVYKLETLTIGGLAYTGYTVENSVYTIPGTAITGDMVIAVSKTQTSAGVTVEGTGAGAAEYEPTITIGEDYTLTITPEAGYRYTVSATMDGEEATVIDNGDNTYTIKNVTGAIAFNVSAEVITDGVSVSEYVTLNGTIMWLVTNTTAVADGKVPTYDGNNMFRSEKYNEGKGAYCYLVVAETLGTDTAKAALGIAEGTAVTVDYGMDVNKTGKVDASDAQLVWNMYNTQYAGFTADVTLEKFLKADVNGSGTITTEDAAAIIHGILGTSSNTGTN